MTLPANQSEAVRAFRNAFRARFSADARFRRIADHDREDGAYLATRFHLNDKLWIEMCVRPSIPQVRVGIATHDRWLSEDLETVIEESGDTMSEFVEMGFEEAGLTWHAPIVEHYRDPEKNFYFATALELKSLADLGDPTVIDKVVRMFNGYYEAFKPGIQRAGE